MVAGSPTCALSEQLLSRTPQQGKTSRTFRVQPRTPPSELIIIDASVFALARRLCAWGPRLCVWTTHNIILTYSPASSGVPSLNSSCVLRQATLATPKWISSHTLGTMYIPRTPPRTITHHRAPVLFSQGSVPETENTVAREDGCACPSCISVRSSRRAIPNVRAAQVRITRCGTTNLTSRCSTQPLATSAPSQTVYV